MKTRFTIPILEKLKEEGKIRGWVEHTKKAPEYAQKRRKNMQSGHKYGARETVVDGITFPSAREAGRYSRLKLLLDAGLITDLQLQVPYELNEGGTHSLKYIADFVYIDVMTSARIVEDAKGYHTKEYRKKRRLMKKVHGITIKEV